MSHRPFRFVHASDFHLEMPLQGMAEVPDHLREPLLEAAYTRRRAGLRRRAGRGGGVPGPLRRYSAPAADRAARAAVPQRAVRPAGPAADSRLLGHRRGRSAGGLARGHSPARECAPIAPRGRVSEFVHQRDGVPLARLLLARPRRQSQRLRAGDFTPDPAGLYHDRRRRTGRSRRRPWACTGIDYWALGGRHDRSTLFSAPQMAHYAGSPQGRRPDEAGVHGCTLVQVDENRQSRTHLVPTDAIRWLERTGGGRGDDRAAATWNRCLRQRCTPCWKTHAEAGPAGVVDRGRRRAAGRAVAAGQAWPASCSACCGASTVSVRRPPGACRWTSSRWPDLPPEWYEQETIRGDFLRAIRQFEMNHGEPLELEGYLSEGHLAGGVGRGRRDRRPAVRQAVLRDAAWLGVDLLSGEEVQS